MTTTHPTAQPAIRFAGRHPASQRCPRTALPAWPRALSALLLTLVLFLPAAPSAKAAALGPIFTLPGKAEQLAARPDGTTLIVDTLNVPLPKQNALHRELRVAELPFLGTNVASCFRTNSSVTGPGGRFPLFNPDVAANETNFVVSFTDKTAVVFGEPHAYDIMMTRGVDGCGLSEPAPVRIETRSWRDADVTSRVAMNAAGTFAIVHYYGYENADAYAVARVFEADGQPRTDNVVVNEVPRAFAPVAGIAMDGTTVYAWENALAYKYSFTGGLDDIHVRRMSPEGVFLGGSFRANSTFQCNHAAPEIAVAPDGRFVVVWVQSGSVADGVYLQRFDSNGVKAGPELRVSPTCGTEPRIAMTPDGRFVVVWQGLDGDGAGIFAQRFLADGAFHGPALWVNEGEEGSQTEPLTEIAADGTFLVKWQQAGTPRARWISWEAQNAAPILGPRVLSAAPSEVISLPLTQVTLTFDRPMDPVTFTLESVWLLDPLTRPVSADSIRNLDGRTFEISFPAQTIPGRYQLKASSQLRALDGAALDENGNLAGGEAADAFSDELILVSTAVASPPLAESFEEAPLGTAGWSFASVYLGDIRLGTNAPHSGTRHLSLTNPGRGFSPSVTLALDRAALSGDELHAGFWARDGAFAVDVSGDGVAWKEILANPAVPRYVEFTFDLDAAARTNGIALDQDVYLRIRCTGGTLLLDDVFVQPGVFRGPRVVGLSPSQLDAGEAGLSTFLVEFDQGMDTATFTGADVLLLTPQGLAVAADTITVAPVQDSGATHFLIRFPNQTARGEYRVQIGPFIASVAGHLMNQDANHSNGSNEDAFNGTISFQPCLAPLAGGPILFQETFENWTGAPCHWSFASYSWGTIQPVQGRVLRGTNSLQFTTPGNTATTFGGTEQSATLRLNLSGHAAETNLVLEFHAAGYWNRSTAVELSADGVVWSTALSLYPPEVFTRYTVDLDHAAAQAGLSLEGDVLLRFRSYVPSSYYPQVEGYVWLEDVRILVGDPTNLQPPRITQPPQGTWLAPGGNTTLCAAAEGSAPLHYQWQLNGANLPRATNACLELTGIQPEQFGRYRVVISNHADVEFSGPAAVARRIGPNGSPETSHEVTGVYGLFSSDSRPIETPWWAGPTLRWHWTAPASGLVDVNTHGSSVNTRLTAWTNCVPGPQCVLAVNEDSDGRQTSRLQFQAVAGATYHFTVDSQWGWRGDIQFELELQPEPVLSSPTRRPDGTVELQFLTAPGRTCRVQASADLRSWTDLIEIPNFTGTGRCLDPEAGSHPIRFYRLLIQP